MESNSKSGKVYLQPRKAGKKWKPVWLTLVPPSSSGVGRLEIHDLGGTTGEHGMRRLQGLGEKKPKVVRLSELLNVQRLPPNAEACPMENMGAFCVEMQEKTLVFSVLKDDCGDWVDKLCHSCFQKNNVPASKQPQMEENVIYASANDVSDFHVVVQRTHAAVRCGLQGAYWLQVGREALQLRDAQKSVVQEWRYELLRRYGNDKGSLSIEMGRRCDCGPGTLVFETLQANTIFSLIQSTIKRKTTHTAPSAGHALEVDKSATLNTRPHSPLPLIPDLTNVSDVFENKLRMHEDGDRTPPTSHPAPITLMPLPSVPKQENTSKTTADNVYADPIDCIKPPAVSTSLYVDPACVLPLKPPGKTDPTLTEKHSVYAEVYDKVSGERFEASADRRADGEPIYSEPMTEKEKEKEEKKGEDPFAHLYAQVCKTPKRSPSPRPRPQETEADQDGDIIYENLGII